MRILLDTHAVLWWLSDDERLGRRARALIGNPQNQILISTASLWEIVIKVRVGKLQADVAEIADTLERAGLEFLDVAVRHLATLGGLPLHHRDPFDHLLVAQAITEDAALMSADRRVTAYPVQVVPCADPAPEPRQH